MWSTRLLLLLMVMCASSGVSYSQDDAKPDNAEVTNEYHAFVAKLGSTDFATRTEATQKLKEAGIPAIPELLKVAEGKEKEIAHRAVMMLIHFATAPDDEQLEAKGKQALMKLSTANLGTISSIAQRVLDPKGNFRRVAEPPRQMPLNVNRSSKSVGITTGGDGQRTVTIQDDNEIVIFDDKHGRDLKITIIKKGDDRRVVDFVNAEDIDALKKTHPDLADLYIENTERFNQRFRGFPRGAGVLNRGRVAPAPVAPRPLMNQTATQTVESTLKMLEELKQNLAGAKSFDDDFQTELKSEIGSIIEKLESTLPAQR